MPFDLKRPSPSAAAWVSNPRLAGARVKNPCYRNSAGWILLFAFFLLCTSCTEFHPSAAPPPASAQWYLASVYQRIALSRHQMPVLQMAGQAAARRVINGGYIWVGGSQTDFGPEA